MSSQNVNDETFSEIFKHCVIFSFRNEWPTTTRRPIDPYILYGPHGYRTFSHARCQEVPTVDVNPSEVNSDSSECTHKVVIIIIRLHDHAISLWMKVTKKVSFYNITILARKFKFLIGFSSNTEFDKNETFLVILIHCVSSSFLQDFRRLVPQWIHH